MRSLWLPALLAMMGFAGCSASAFPGRADPKQERLDVLTSFTLALSKHDYRAAAGFLAPEDRAKLASADAGILPEYRERVGAIRRATLLNNPLIEIRRGFIFGIPDVLPVLAQGHADSLDLHASPDTGWAAVPDSTRSEAAREKELKRAAGAFFRAVSKQEWERALGLLDPGERQEFLDPKGKLKADEKWRLASVDTTQWEALTLKDGKLTGVVLIIPEPRGRVPAL
jgi:hypothetical protein